MGWVDTTHDDLEGRVTIGDTGSGTHDHSTHVAGTMLGDGTKSAAEGGTPLQWRGMAPNSIVISYEWWNDLEELNDEYDSAINTYGIDLSTNSWGWGRPGYYGVYNEYAQAIDSVVVGSCGERIPVMWAAGNDRPLCDNNMYDCILLPGTAKNTITIGATNSNDDSMTSFSSWGPTDDGRIKPDIVAPGCENDGPDSCEDIYTDPSKGIWSTIPDDIFTDSCPPPHGDGIDDFQYPYSGACGTSMATPAVAGSVALLIEDWRNIHDGNDPLPSTIKAILAHTAKPLGNKGPDYSYGYGRIDVKEAIDLIDDANDANNIFEDSIVDQNDTDHYDINVPQGQGELVITLVWDDYPGDPAADKALVNDLDLIVKDPNGKRYYPWTLDPDIPNKTARRNQPDHINNIEQVCVYHPVNSTWSIDVNGPNVPEPEQKYSLVYNFNVIPKHTDKFRVKDESGDSVAWFDDSGNLFLKATLYQNSKHPPTGHNEFRVQDVNSVVVAIIDTTNGKMYIKGSRKTLWQDPSAGNGEFIIRNSEEPVAYINQLGDMYLKGNLYENYSP